jgi:phosphate transport system protein
MITENIKILKEKIIHQAHAVEKMIACGTSILVNRDPGCWEELLKNEDQVNLREREIEKLVMQSLARFQPEAKDLRTVLMILKMNNDLERMGDLAVNIGESAISLLDQPKVKPLIDLPRMADETTKMVKFAIQSFLTEDADLARKTCESDDTVDSLNDQIFRELVTYMVGNANLIKPAMHLIRIARNYERIADLSTNVAEQTIYISEGTDIKHLKDQKKPILNKYW